MKLSSKKSSLSLVVGLLTLVTLFGCSPAEDSATSNTGEETATAVAERSLRLYVFDCGRIDATDLSAFSLEITDVPTTEMFVPCYIIDHPSGRLLWDAGLPPSTADSPDGVEMPGAKMTLDRTLQDQLSELEMPVDSIDQVAFSHMHFDHVGHANLFSHAKLLIQREEHAAAFAEGDDLSPVFDPTLYSALVDSEVQLLDGDFDVFGDGTVQIISAPGHTPGHQVLLLDLDETGKILLSGDLYHFQASREKRTVPTFNHDAEQTLETMDRIENLLDQTGATLWIEHDMPFTETLQLAPAYYQ